MRTTILLVDDNPKLLDAVSEMLAENFTVLGALGCGKEVLANAARLVPAVIVLDISLPDINGFDVASALAAAQCPSKIVFLSIYEGPEFVRRAFDVGAKGYVFKSRMCDLPEAIKRVAAGALYDPEIRIALGR